MGFESLEMAIQRAGSPVELLRNARALPYTFPVPSEFTNWRSEQSAWRDTCALLDQSHHMADLFISGPEALKLLSDLGVNSFRGFEVDNAKQFVAANYDGFLIGDGILFYLAEESFDLVGAHPMVLDWVQYNLETGGYDAITERDENSLDRRDRPPKLYRYEIQGPTAGALMEEVSGAPLPEIKFFHMGVFAIAGHRVRALRHGMAGQPGFELFGPWVEGEAVRDRLIEVGVKHGLVCAGAKAYATANLESGWVPSPMPAVFSGEQMKPFREWRSAERMGSLGGSLYSADIADYYVTPYDLGYGRSVVFDHDFIGRGALEKVSERPPRAKVTLVWDNGDMTRVAGSLYGEEHHAKYFDMPKARYALFQCDEVLKGGKRVGISMDCGYIYNERAMVSLATIDVALCAPGTEVVVVWGEEPNSTKPQVEPHRQVEIRATVAPVPYVDFARSVYRSASTKDFVGQSR